MRANESGRFNQHLHDLIDGNLPPGTLAYSPFADPAARSGEVMLRRANGQLLQAYIRHAVAVVQSGGKRAGIRTRSVVHDLSRERAVRVRIWDDLAKVPGLQVQYQRFDGLGHGPMLPASLRYLLEHYP